MAVAENVAGPVLWLPGLLHTGNRLSSIRRLVTTAHLVFSEKRLWKLSAYEQTLVFARALLCTVLRLQPLRRPTSAANSASASLHELRYLIHHSPTTSTSTGMAATCSKPQPDHCNIVQWALSGQYNPNKPVLIDACNPLRSISKNKAVELIASLTGAFKQNTTVCLHLDNDILYPILCMAIYASKCRWTGTNTGYKAPELKHHFDASDTKYVITSEEHLREVRKAVAESKTRPEIVIWNDIFFAQPQHRRRSCATRDFKLLSDLQKRSTPAALYTAIRDIDICSIATLMTTSGTTGPPKMAARTHQATVLETHFAEDNHHLKPFEVRRLFCTPIFHSFSTPEMVINTLRLGYPSYFMKRFDNIIYPQKIQEFNITDTFAPPSMLLLLIQKSEAHKQIQSLRTIYTGGAPFVPELRSKFLKIFKNPDQVHIQCVWGMTEGGWFTTFKYPHIDHTGSVGETLPGFEIVMSEHGRSTLSSGQEAGELWVRGPDVMSYYWKNPQATNDAFMQDGWLRTGDVGYIKDEKVYLVDRAKDLIKVHGFQVAPVELEDALTASNLVKEVGVIGYGEDVEERPLAFVVRTEDSSVTEKELKDWVFPKLISYKTKTLEIWFIDQLPRGPSGKILKTTLRKIANSWTGGSTGLIVLKE